jgi:hypothetical protein
MTTQHTIPSSDTHDYQLPADTFGPSPTSKLQSPLLATAGGYVTRSESGT